VTRKGTSDDAALLRDHAQPLTNAATDYDRLIEKIGDRRVVLIGEASHGTHEFYRERARITRRLIEEKDFNAVAVEADFPDAARVNRYVKGTGEDDKSADDALGDFIRFPRWMWRNRVMIDFVSWLHEHNEAREQKQRINFYGIDLYSLHASVAEVLEYLERVDPQAAARARERYNCFEHFTDSQEYGFAASTGHTEPCEKGAVEQLVEMQRRAGELASIDGRQAAEEFFNAEQNARLVQNAEEYYRSMFRGRVSSWNLRDRHMTETVEAIINYGDWRGEKSKVVVWAHNSHLGDARATEMSERGEWNVGQLVRERFGEAAVNIGFTTYTGTVTAANDWGEAAQLKQVRPGARGSYEEMFHTVGIKNFLLDLSEPNEATELLNDSRLERAIGVIYRPETERVSHYFHARLTEQFDHVIHIDETRAVEPLERGAGWQSKETAEELPDTFPTGM